MKTKISTLHLTRDSIRQKNDLEKNLIIFVLEGGISLSIGDIAEKTISSREMLLIPPQKKYKIRGLEEDSLLVIINFEDSLSSTPNGNRHFIVDLVPYLEKKDEELVVLKIHERLALGLKFIDICIGGSEHEYLKELKINEILYLLFKTYPKKDLAAFFCPLLCDDLQFKESVLKRSVNAKTVIELASLLNYSTSGFIKRFKKHFNESPYRWMQKQKATNILFDLKKGDKTPTQVSYDYDFSSYEHFVRFCKAQYGRIPTEVVKKFQDKM